jgi:hypothetical protein
MYGVAGIAQQIGFNNADNVPSKYKGSVCWKNQFSEDANKDRKIRTGISEYTGPASTQDEWDFGKLAAALVNITYHLLFSIF